MTDTRKKIYVERLHLTEKELKKAREMAEIEYERILQRTPWLKEIINSPDRYKYLGY